MSFELHYSRFVYNTTPTGGPGNNPTLSSAPEISSTRRDLDALTLEIEAPDNKGKLLQVAEQLKKVNYRDWYTMDGAQKSLAKIRVAFAGIKGVDTMADGIKNGSQDSLDTLKGILDTVDGIIKTQKESILQREGIEVDTPKQKVGEWLTGIQERFNRGSGTEKLLSAGAIVALGVFIYNHDGLKKFLSYGAAAFGANWLVGLATGKSILDRFGVLTNIDQMPAGMKNLAKATKIDKPEELVAMAKMGSIDIKTLYRKYREHSQGKKIDPVSLGFYDKEIDGESVFKIIEGTVKLAGGPQAFEKQFINVDTKFTFDQVAWAVGSVETADALSGLDKDGQTKLSGQLSEIFSGVSGFSISSEGKGITPIIAGFPLKDIARGDGAGSNPGFVFEFAGGRRVIMHPKDDASKRSENCTKLIEFKRQDLETKLKNTPFGGMRVDFDGSQFVLNNVTLQPGTLPKKIVLRPEGGDNIIFDIDGETFPAGKNPAEMAASLDAALNLRTALPILKGLDLRVTKVDGNLVTFEVDKTLTLTAHRLGAGVYQLDNPQQLLTSPSFVNIKREAFRKKLMLDSDFAILMNGMPENFWKVWQIFGGNKTGSVSESLWKVGVESTQNAMVKMYENSLRGARDLADAAKQEENLLSFFQGQAKTLRNSIQAGMESGNNAERADFNIYYEQLVSLNFADPKAGNEVARYCQQFVQNINHEGIDRVDVVSNWASVHKRVLAPFLELASAVGMEQPVTEQGMAYLRYLGEHFSGKIVAFTSKDSGVLWSGLHKSLNSENIADWGAKTYEQFTGKVSGGNDGGRERGPETVSAVPGAWKAFFRQYGIEEGGFEAKDFIADGRDRLSTYGIVKVMNHIVYKCLNETKITIAALQLGLPAERSAMNQLNDVVKNRYFDGGEEVDGGQYQTLRVQIENQSSSLQQNLLEQLRNKLVGTEGSFTLIYNNAKARKTAT